MKTKRPTPKKLPSGAWRCQVMVDGKRISVTEETAKLAQAKAMAIQSGLMEKQQEDKKKELLLCDAIEDYLTRKADDLSPSTIRSYAWMKDHRLLSLMKKDISTIDREDVQKAVDEEVKRLSTKSVINAYGMVRVVLKEHGINVFGVQFPKRKKPETKFVQKEEIALLLQAAERDPYCIEILLALWLGMRRSEILGLCWDAIDFRRKAITIKRTCVQTRNGKIILRDGTKTYKSQREISCPDYILSKLEALKKSTGGKQGRIFGEYPNTLTRHVHSVCSAAGITDTTLHGLRHTNAAIMRFLQIPDNHAMARGGWSDEKTYKDRYSYVFTSVAQDSDLKIDRFFNEQNVFAHEIAHERK